jgi:hypothetical protein
MFQFGRIADVRKTTVWAAVARLQQKGALLFECKYKKHKAAIIFLYKKETNTRPLMERSDKSTNKKTTTAPSKPKGQRKNSAEAEEDEKKQTLRTSTDVYHRVKWDEVPSILPYFPCIYYFIFIYLFN